MTDFQIRPSSAMSKIVTSENFKKLPLSQIEEENVSSKLKRTRLTSAKSSAHMPVYSELQATKAMKGKSTQFHESRKENYLNSCFNKRKNDLLRITKENRRIYERINSQQSNYSTKKGNKSMESNCSRVSARSSSKFSNSKNNSRAGSAKNGRRKLLKENNKHNEKPLIEEKNVKNINEMQAKKFKNMFFQNLCDQVPVAGVSLPMRRPKTVKREKLQKKKEQKEKENCQFFLGNEDIKIKKSVSNKKTRQLEIKHTNCRYNAIDSRKKNIFIGLGMENSARNDKLTKILSEMGFRYQYC